MICEVAIFELQCRRTSMGARNQFTGGNFKSASCLRWTSMSGARSLKSDEVLGVQGVSKLTKLPEWKIRSRSFEDRTFPPAIDEERLLWTARRSSSISPSGHGRRFRLRYYGDRSSPRSRRKCCSCEQRRLGRTASSISAAYSQQSPESLVDCKISNCRSSALTSRNRFSFLYPK